MIHLGVIAVINHHDNVWSMFTSTVGGVVHEMKKEKRTPKQPKCSGNAIGASNKLGMYHVVVLTLSELFTVGRSR